MIAATASHPDGDEEDDGDEDDPAADAADDAQERLHLLMAASRRRRILVLDRGVEGGRRGRVQRGLLLREVGRGAMARLRLALDRVLCGGKKTGISSLVTGKWGKSITITL